jgi:hypothetical protein
MSPSRHEQEQKEQKAHMDSSSHGVSPDEATASAVVPNPHTPGPWWFDVGGNIWTRDAPYGRGEMMVGMVRGWGHLTGRGGGCAFAEDKAVAIQEANARLIAAAPELLAALKACAKELRVRLNEYEPDPVELLTAERLIVEAEGL